MMQEENDTPLTADDLELYTRSHIEAMAERIAALEANQAVLHQKIADLNRDVFQLNKNVKATDARLLEAEAKVQGWLDEQDYAAQGGYDPDLEKKLEIQRDRRRAHRDHPFLRVVTFDGVPAEVK